MPEALAGLRFECRRGTLADAPVIAALAIQVFLDTYAPDGIAPEIAREVLDGYGEEAFLARLREGDTSWIVAETPAGLVGFAQLTRGRSGPAPSNVGDHELVHLYVQPAMHGKGVGGALLRAAESLARDAGASHLWLTAWDGNHRAHAFYEHARYRRTGTTEHVIGTTAYENHVFAKSLRDSS
jgi:GNAT superfamily N-acetyltransferase